MLGCGRVWAVRESERESETRNPAGFWGSHIGNVRCQANKRQWVKVVAGQILLQRLQGNLRVRCGSDGLLVAGSGCRCRQAQKQHTHFLSLPPFHYHRQRLHTTINIVTCTQRTHQSKTDTIQTHSNGEHTLSFAIPMVYLALSSVKKRGEHQDWRDAKEDSLTRRDLPLPPSAAYAPVISSLFQPPHSL